MTLWLKRLLGLKTTRGNPETIQLAPGALSKDWTAPGKRPTVKPVAQPTKAQG